MVYLSFVRTDSWWVSTSCLRGTGTGTHKVSKRFSHRGNIHIPPSSSQFFLHHESMWYNNKLSQSHHGHHCGSFLLYHSGCIHSHGSGGEDGPGPWGRNKKTAFGPGTFFWQTVDGPAKSCTSWWVVNNTKHPIIYVLYIYIHRVSTILLVVQDFATIHRRVS